MKKLAAVFITLLFASTASAQIISNPTTNARMDGMGVANWQIEDDFNIFINPAQLSNYKNNVYGELGNYTPNGNDVTNATSNDRINPWGGMNIDASYGGWGVYLGRPYGGSIPSATGSTGPLAAMGVTPPAANRFDLFYATHGMPLGLYLSYASVATDVKTAGVKTTDDASELNLGGGLLLNKNLDLALNIDLPSSKCSNVAGLCAGTTVKSKTSAAGNLSLLGRFHMPMGGNSKLLATGQILLEDASVKGVDATGMTVRVDAAINSKPNTSTLLVAGAGIVSTSFDVKPKGGAKTTTGSLAIPVNVAVEHQTFKAVKTRVGLAKAIYNTTDCKNVDPTCTAAGANKVTKVADGNATLSMGFGWAIADNLSLDAVLNQDILFTGSYVVSGIPETLSSKLSATYRF